MADQAFLNNAKAPVDFVYNAGFIKIREVTFNYTVPQKFFTKYKAIKGIDISRILKEVNDL